MFSLYEASCSLQKVLSVKNSDSSLQLKSICSNMDRRHIYKFLTSLHIRTGLANKITPQHGQVNPKLLNSSWNNIVIHYDCSPKKKIADFGVGDDLTFLQKPNL